MRTMIKSKQMLVDLLLQHLRFPSGCFVLVSALDPFEDIGGGGEVTFACWIPIISCMTTRLARPAHSRSQLLTGSPFQQTRDRDEVAGGRNHANRCRHSFSLLRKGILTNRKFLEHLLAELVLPKGDKQHIRPGASNNVEKMIIIIHQKQAVKNESLLN